MSDIKTMFNKLKRQVSNTTLKKIRTVINMVLDKAVSENLIESNPMKFINRLPKSSVQTKEGRVLDDAEMKETLSLAEDDTAICGMIYLLVYIGMRPSELRVLKISDTDMEQCKIHIQCAATEYYKHDENGNCCNSNRAANEPKNVKYGNRIISMPRTAIEMDCKRFDFRRQVIEPIRAMTPYMSED